MKVEEGEWVTAGNQGKTNILLHFSLLGREVKKLGDAMVRHSAIWSFL